MAQKIQILVDGRTVEAAPGAPLLELLQSRGCEIPTLCHHPDLAPAGSCRLCVVEIEARGKRRLVASCTAKVRDGMSVSTASEPVLAHRRRIAAMHLGRWPRVPVIQEIARRCGVVDASAYRGTMTDENPRACVLCTRCVRACEEFVQQRILDFAGRGARRHMTMAYGDVDPHCIGCTSCAYVCPTGAIQVVDDLNHPHDPVMIRDHGMKVNAEMARLDPQQCRMRQVGTANIIDVMDQYDLLPCHNFKFGSHPDAKKIYSAVFRDQYLTQGEDDGCWKGCSMACAKAAEDFELKTGPYAGRKVLVDGPEYENAGACANMGCFDPWFALEWNFYCDTYGVDTISFGTCMAFVMEAFEAGVITEAQTGGKKLRFGAMLETLECLHEMARGEGFGVDVGQGIRWLKEKWVREYGADPAFLQDIGMEVKGLEVSEYVAKESVAQQAGYSMAVKGPQHDEAWLIFMDMVNNQIPSFEDKAEALYYFPLWRTWFGLMGLCKLLWNDVVPVDNKTYPPQQAAKVPDHVRNYFKFFEGMTGIPLDDEKMLAQSARVHNLQRIMSYRCGRGTREHDLPPYRMMGPVTAEEYESRAERYDKQLREILGVDPAGKPVEEKIRLLRAHREAQYVRVLETAYERRGWTRNGVPRISRLKELGIDLPEITAIVRDAQD
ncbi:MAG: (2Fe-2S)-binding protein [Candidatus Eisenbacteria bacterium]|uniref:(2Fe-2S)-binding protein n=1 Tax=Eiseniibacteriota bacterium TaxID=2212470 RepID=A0A937XC99_UNCEI|nr:(2Fe-2S)-binding protein [Candidatus Eisenbacteria bacterium]